VLEKKLASARQDLADYRAFVGERLNISGLTEDANENSNQPIPPLRDDDSHYFQSYGANGLLWFSLSVGQS